MARKITVRPLVYSCSGCSSAAQMANALAIRLDREGVAEMSCIAGVGGNVRKLVRTARSGRLIVALDGCPLACTRACLHERGLSPDLHRILTDDGVRKRYREDFDPDEAKRIYRRILPETRQVGAERDQGITDKV